MFVLSAFGDRQYWASCLEPLLYPSDCSFYRPFSYHEEYVAEPLKSELKDEARLDGKFRFAISDKDSMAAPRIDEVLPLHVPVLTRSEKWPRERIFYAVVVVISTIGALTALYLAYTVGQSTFATRQTGRAVVTFYDARVDGTSCFLPCYHSGLPERPNKGKERCRCFDVRNVNCELLLRGTCKREWQANVNMIFF